MSEPCVIAIGKESVGKSQLIASLTGHAAISANFRGTTVDCELYPGDGCTFVDTPGIFRESDTATTRLTLSRLEQSDTVLLVLQATRLDEDLEDLLPLVQEKKGAAVVTFWDKLPDAQARRGQLQRLQQACNFLLLPVDSRRLSEDDRKSILAAVHNPRPIRHRHTPLPTDWRQDSPRTWIEHRLLGRWIGLLLLLAPAILAVYLANGFAAAIDPAVQTGAKALASRTAVLPSLAREILAGRFGLLTMGPLLFVWAVPTVTLYALILGSYKASGLLERISVAVDPLMRPFGLSGRDLVRVIMGFGCNVPAVICTRACSVCSRGTTIAAIAFGAACSYQLGATLAVFAAAGHSLLVVPYLLYLTATTLLFVRLTSPPLARSPINGLAIDSSRVFLEWPRWASIGREVRGVMVQFFRKAIPIFFLITLLASLLDWLGWITVLARLLGPLMRLFRLPAEAALPVVLAMIRKDGILLFAETGTLSHLTAAQILTGVYLAGVLVPCLVTALTIARERSLGFALKLMARQAVAACIFSLVLAWASAFLLR
jgi:Fe2+ transport system protein B